ncbi:GntR family transcriptional regulator [Herbiconiux moechotypicola]|uniref:GntR family transcriptional regulator n=1 Tax=Herbiconiux moechotypicola TaxID=637393 RepID=A0ABP5Q8G3_9MICO|nr:GntR family transcriptional regulator [Herbiconiux moechotypicola]MCS5729240.1 GntR family transcriptional regulator [Herbiconiux moechotypicola]
MPAVKIERHAAPLRQQVVLQLREDILEGVLAPGDRLLENTLCESYGVSRTVVREALRQLETESLITMLPGRGPIVTVLTRHDIESLYEVRRALEGLAAELFAREASDDQAARMRILIDSMEHRYLRGTVESREESKEEFYRLLLEGAGNPVLESQLRGVHTRIGLFRRYAFVDERRVAISMEELRQIVHELAVTRDPFAARQASEHHIQLAGELAVLEYTKRLGHSGQPSQTEAIAI